MKKPLCLNFLAGPGSGKSTSAAAVFAHLKNSSCNVELITEYAKRICYERTEIKLRNQLYITAKQYKLMKDVADYGVPLIITDSPLVLGLIYGKDFCQPEFEALIRKINSEFENLYVFVRRVKPYNPSGRLQDEKKSDQLSEEIRALGIKFNFEIDGDPDGQSWLANRIYNDYWPRIKIK